MSTAQHTDPALWEKVKNKVTKGAKGGKPGQWSARKAQMATAEYKKEGGGFEGAKREDNSLHQWTKEEWGTKSGKKSGETGERYLPKEAREHLSDEEYKRTTQKKRQDTKKGKQFSAQPDDVAEKTAKDRHHEPAKAAKAKAGGGKKTAHSGEAAPAKGASAKSGHETDGGTKAELYAEAKKRDIPGRSSMSKAQLEKALAH